MSKEPKTAQQWLALPDKDLPVELGRVLTPKEEWKHRWHKYPRGFRKCTKCEMKHRYCKDDSCSVPDPVTIDWNTAIGIYRQLGPQRVDMYLHRIWEVLIEIPISKNYMSYEMWKDEDAQPKHYLIAAAMAVARRTK